MRAMPALRAEATMVINGGKANSAKGFCPVPAQQAPLREEKPSAVSATTGGREKPHTIDSLPHPVCHELLELDSNQAQGNVCSWQTSSSNALSVNSQLQTTAHKFSLVSRKHV